MRFFCWKDLRTFQTSHPKLQSSCCQGLFESMPKPLSRAIGQTPAHSSMAAMAKTANWTHIPTFNFCFLVMEGNPLIRIKKCTELLAILHLVVWSWKVLGPRSWSTKSFPSCDMWISEITENKPLNWVHQFYPRSTWGCWGLVVTTRLIPSSCNSPCNLGPRVELVTGQWRTPLLSLKTGSSELQHLDPRKW